MTTVVHRAPDVSAGGAGAGHTHSPTSWRVPAGGVILAVGFLVSILSVGRDSLSLDESVSTTLAYSPWHSFTQTVLHREANMSLYYLLLHVLIGLFGNGTFAIRLPSVISIAATAGLTSAIALRLFGARVAFAAGLVIQFMFHLVGFVSKRKAK